MDVVTIPPIQERLGTAMMLSYPVYLEADDNGTFLATCPDFPEVTTFSDDEDEARSRSVDALEEAIAARVHSGQALPAPSFGAISVPLPALTAIKAMLYQGMREQGIGKAELARRLGWHLPQVDRVLDVNHNSRLDQMEAALGAIGRQLEVTVSDR